MVKSKAEYTLLEIKNLLYSDSSIKLSDVIEKFREYLYLPDTKMLETMLAVSLSNRIKGTPIWILFVGSSSCGKATTVNSLSKLDNVYILKEITKNTFISGLKQNDLGYELQNKDTIILIPDMACISSIHKDERKSIFAKMRDLYDGYLEKSVAGDINKHYKNIHTTLIMNATPIVKREYLIHLQLGSRELLFEIDDIDIKGFLAKSWENDDKEKEMEEELSNVVYDFLMNIKIEDIDISEDMRDFIEKQANLLSILRALGDYNQYTDELETDIYWEVPSRVLKQFKRLYICLKSLDSNYSDKRCKDIIRHISNSSGNDNRRKILDVLDKRRNESFTVYQMANITKLGRRAVKRELEALWNMDLLSKEPFKRDNDKIVEWADKMSYYYSLNEKMYNRLLVGFQV